MASTDGVTNLQYVPAGSLRSREDNDFKAYAQLTFDLASDDGQLWVAFYVVCHLLLPGEAVVVFRHIILAEHFDESYDAVDDVIESLVLPRQSLEAIPSGDIKDVPRRGEFQAGSLTVQRYVGHLQPGDIPPPAVGSHYAASTVEFTNTSSDTLLVNANDIYLKDQYQYWFTNSHYRWDAVPHNPSDETLQLAPGEASVVTTIFTVPDDVVIASVHCVCPAFPELGIKPICTLHDSAGALTQDLEVLSMGGNNIPYENATLVFDRAGNERVMVTMVRYAYDSQTDSRFYVFAFENVGDSSIVVNADDFHLRNTDPDTTSAVLRGTDAVWTLTPGESTSRTQRLAPGTRAVLGMWFHQSGDYGVWAPGDVQLIDLGSIGVVDSGGGPGRPRISRGG